MLTLLHPGIEPDGIRNIHRVIPNLDQKPDLSLMPSPRVIKSHSLFDSRYPRIIYLLRDGRDATYSYYVFCQKEFGYSGSFRDFLVHSPFPPSRWHEHVDSWLNSGSDARLLLIRYEDMLVDEEVQLKRALDFLGWQPREEYIAKAIRDSTIDIMREKERAGYFLAHVRLGKQGDWRERYSAEELAIFMDVSGEALKRFGYA